MNDPTVVIPVGLCYENVFCHSWCVDISNAITFTWRGPSALCDRLYIEVKIIESSIINPYSKGVTQYKECLERLALYH